jgi:hypothetical protein
MTSWPSACSAFRVGDDDMRNDRMTQTIDAAELDMIRASLRHALDSASPADLPGLLLAEGWADLVDAAPAEAITALCEQAGSARSAAPAADLAVQWGAGLAADAGTVVLYDGVALAGGNRATTFLTLSSSGIARLPSEAVELSPIGGIDPTFGLLRATALPTTPDLIGGPDQTAAAIAVGRLAFASQMVGAAEQMLADTIAYVLERHQYGRAIGSFQTVKHRLADVKVAVTAARSATRAAWETAGNQTGDITAMAAKALAARAQLLASTHCFQVHGGIAFTVEHGFQTWVRRGVVLDHLLGSHETLAREVGQRLIAARDTPRVPDLF